MMKHFIFSLIIVFFALPAFAQDGWQCYKSCMASGGKLPAECNNECQLVRNAPPQAQNIPSPQRRSQAAPRYAPAPAVHTHSQGRLPADNRDAFVNQKCYNTCISHGKMHGLCVSECNNPGLAANKPQPPSQEWYQNQGDVRGGIVPRQKPAAPVTDDFRVHFGCFKQCRSEANDFTDCRKMCTQ